jgi:hypothetical protein
VSAEPRRRGARNGGPPPIEAPLSHGHQRSLVASGAALPRGGQRLFARGSTWLQQEAPAPLARRATFHVKRVDLVERALATASARHLDAPAVRQ